ncbi:MAG TPA: hypothetical protein VN843_24135 [Anaerolineales bacterium]|nr:hypothetical protein [Anaerolineales bacterium]
MKYFGLALADSMFTGDCVIERKLVNAEDAKAYLAGGYSSCCNPSHVATLTALKTRHDIVVNVPSVPPKVVMNSGDTIMVFGVRGLPRLTDRHEYTDEEIAKATFSFVLYTVK